MEAKLQGRRPAPSGQTSKGTLASRPQTRFRQKVVLTMIKKDQSGVDGLLLFTADGARSAMSQPRREAAAPAPPQTLGGMGTLSSSIIPYHRTAKNKRSHTRAPPSGPAAGRTPTSALGRVGLEPLGGSSADPRPPPGPGAPAAVDQGEEGFVLATHLFWSTQACEHPGSDVGHSGVSGGGQAEIHPAITHRSFSPRWLRPSPHLSVPGADWGGH